MALKSQVDLFAKNYTTTIASTYATPYKAVSLAAAGSPIFLTGSGDSAVSSGTLVQKIAYDGTVLKSKFLGLGITYGNYANIATNGTTRIAVTTRGNTYEGNQLILFDTDLNIVSTQCYKTALGYSTLSAIGYHSSGHYFVGGSGLGNAPIAMNKIDESGNLIWSKTLLSGDAGDIRVIKETTDGNMIVAGALDNNAGALTDAFVLKMTPDGDVLWATESHLGDQAQVMDVLEQPYSKGFVAVGGFNTTTGTNTNGFVWQLSTAGVSKTTLKLYYYSSLFTKIEAMDYGHFMVAGNGQKAFGIAGSMIFAEFDENINVTKNHCFNNSVWLTLPSYLHYEANGTLTTTFVNGIARFDPAFNYIPCLATTCDLDTYSIAGEYTALQGSIFNFPLTKATYPISLTDFTSTENTICDTTVNSVASSVASSDSKKETSFLVYPNPTSNTISFSQNAISSITNFEILNCNGQLLKKYTGENTSSSIDLTWLQGGIYFIKIHTIDGQNQTQKIIKL